MGTLKAGLKARETYLEKSKPRTENYTEVASEQGRSPPGKEGQWKAGGWVRSGQGVAEESTTSWLLGGGSQRGVTAPGERLSTVPRRR